MAKTAKPVSELSFESALAELEQIVTRLEGSDVSLEQSLQSYQRGAQLLKYCQSQLAEAEQRVRLFENGELREFEPAPPDESSAAK